MQSHLRSLRVIMKQQIKYDMNTFLFCLNRLDSEMCMFDIFNSFKFKDGVVFKRFDDYVKCSELV